MNIPDIQSMLSDAEDHGCRILCVGAGEALKEACVAYNRYDFFHRIYKIFDKKARHFEFENQIKEVLPTENIVDYVGNSIIYITSNNYYIEIYNQLEKLIDMSNVKCYIHNHVKHIPVPYDISKRFNQPMIPKIIHYCWFGNHDIPEKNKEWMNSWAKYCPDYEIIRWDESNYDYQKNKYIKEAYEQGKYAFVSDYARMDILYNNGGIYLDTDVELLNSLDTLLYNEAYSGTYYSYQGAAFGLGVGAIKGFPLLKEMMEIYEDLSFINSDGTLNMNDCLFYQTKILKKYGYEPSENVLQVINGMTIYPTDVLAPMDVDGVVLSKTKNTISMHHFDASWFEEKTASEFKRKIKACREFAIKYDNDCLLGKTDIQNKD